jgi:hypothetical protein
MTSHRLQELSPVPLKITWHENKSVYFAVKKERKGFSFRVHRLFYDAPTPVLEALIGYATKKDKASRAIIKQMAHLHFSQTVSRAEPLDPVGEVYNLQEIYDQFKDVLGVEGINIGWSNRKRGGKFHSITFGTYDKHCRQIRINPLLDDLQVPLYFVEFIVYHEMLHAVCPSRIDTHGRCFVHTEEFRQKERQYPHFAKAKEWEKKSLMFFKKKGSHGRT